jgi:hypothetical protein
MWIKGYAIYNGFIKNFSLACLNFSKTICRWEISGNREFEYCKPQNMFVPFNFMFFLTSKIIQDKLLKIPLHIL